MHLSGILVGSVTLHIVSLFCACVGVILSLTTDYHSLPTITHYCTVDFHISRGLRYGHKDVWGKPILTGKQVGLCVSTCNYLLAASRYINGRHRKFRTHMFECRALNIGRLWTVGY